MAEKDVKKRNLGEEERVDFVEAMKKVRAHTRKLNEAKREAEEIKFLNIVAMMDMMTILLVFLLKNVTFSNDAVTTVSNLDLPHTKSEVAPMESVKILITKEAIIVEDRMVAEIKSGLVSTNFVSKANNFYVPTLKEALDTEIDRQLSLGSSMGKDLEFQSDLSIFADSDTQYTTVMQILYSSGQATGTAKDRQVGFNKYHLSALRLEM